MSYTPNMNPWVVIFGFIVAAVLVFVCIACGLVLLSAIEITLM